MTREKITERHESYGMISLTRIQGNYGQTMFGSSIKHQNVIEIKISTAENDRKLNRNWYHAKENIVTLALSPTQFAEAITTMNTTGVPCTLQRIGTEEMEKCPDINYREVLEKEFKKDIMKILGNLNKTLKLSEETLRAKGTLSRKDRDELADLLFHLEQDIRANLPYVQKSFNEQVDKSVTEAKGELDAFVTNMVQNLGLDALKDKLLDVDTDVPILIDQQK